MKSLLSTALVCGTALALAACGGGGGSPETPADTPKTEGSAAAPAFEGRVDGKPVVFKSVLAATLGGSGIEVVASTEDIDCAAAGGFSKEGEKRAKFLLAPALLPDGKRAWKLVRAAYVNGTTGKNEPLADFQGDAKSGVKVTLPQMAVTYIDAGAEKKVELGGPIVAKGCGERVEDKAPPRPQKEAALEVAGEKLALQGAVLQRTADGDTLVVSTRPIPCRNGVPGEDVRVHVNLPKGQEASLSISGVLVPVLPAHYFGDKKPAVTLGTPSDGVVPVTVDLDEKNGDYTVKLKGTVQAALCEE